MVKQLFVPCQWKRTSRVKLISWGNCVFTCHSRWPWHAASNYPQSTLCKNTQEFRLNTRAYLISFLVFVYLFRAITEILMVWISLFIASKLSQWGSKSINNIIQTIECENKEKHEDAPRIMFSGYLLDLLVTVTRLSKQ